MRAKLSLLLASSLILAACASNKPKDASGDPEAARAVATARPGSAGPGDQGAPTLVGPDIIAAVPADVAWKTLSDVENWGAWNPKVTAVKPGAGLNTGTELEWKWEEKTIHSTITAVKDGESLVLKGSRTGSDVSLRWLVKGMDPTHTVVSLRAALRPGASATQIANAGVETQAWMEAMQTELNKKAAAYAPAPAKKAKKASKKAP